MSWHIILSLIGVLALASIHLFAGHLHRGARFRPTWLTVASGMSVAYVFVDLLPEVAKTQQEWLASPYRVLPWLDTGVYVAALAGLIVYLTLDHMASARSERHFWLNIAGFALYNALIGAFAVRATSIPEVVLGVIAFGAHFLINDHNLCRQYGEVYERSGRWVLATSIVVGWGVTALWTFPTIIVAIVVALVAGGIMLDVIKEEIPKREGRLSPWIAGAITYTLLILALTYTEQAQ